ncbi:N-acetyllactosaminide 3-alpha-galactosyltransferase, partial [Teladorsagia circumcincta]
PYRNREEELSEFAPHMTKFLRGQRVDHYLIVMNQTDEFRFNRASLINVGWFECDRLGCDYMVMHDVDLLPLNPEISYRFPGEGVVKHISAPQFHPKYNYTKFIGGVLMLTMNDYKALNGMSNKYWGWGLEDDEFYLRIKDGSLNLTRVANLSTNRSNTFRHIHGVERKRDYAVVTKEQKAMKRKRDRVSGLNSVRYNITARRTLSYGDATHIFEGSHLRARWPLKWQENNGLRFQEMDPENENPVKKIQKGVKMHQDCEKMKHKDWFCQAMRVRFNVLCFMQFACDQCEMTTPDDKSRKNVQEQRRETTLILNCNNFSLIRDNENGIDQPCEQNIAIN